MKGIILAGGSGSRLGPLTRAVSKQLLPIGDKPLIYYPLSVLMLADIREILIIVNRDHLSAYQMLLGDGNHLGISISYECQNQPNGIAEAFIIGEKFLDGSPVGLILGDNIFYGHGLGPEIASVSNNPQPGATIWGCKVDDPARFGVVEMDCDQNPVSIEEKPENPKSPYAVTGLYFYDSQVVEFAKKLKPSWRGELEITDINNAYLNSDELALRLFGRGTLWIDAGTVESFIQANQFVHAVESRQGVKIGCLEEISLNKGWIDLPSFIALQRTLEKSSYGKYMAKIVDERKARESI